MEIRGKDLNEFPKETMITINGYELLEIEDTVSGGIILEDFNYAVDLIINNSSSITFQFVDYTFYGILAEEGSSVKIDLENKRVEIYLQSGKIVRIYQDIDRY